MKKGDRIKVNGHGRTASWAKDLIGTVTRRSGDSVFVHWDNTYFEDQMDIEEVELFQE